MTAVASVRDHVQKHQARLEADSRSAENALQFAWRSGLSQQEGPLRSLAEGLMEEMTITPCLGANEANNPYPGLALSDRGQRLVLAAVNAGMLMEDTGEHEETSPPRDVYKIGSILLYHLYSHGDVICIADLDGLDKVRTAWLMAKEYGNRQTADQLPGGKGNPV